MFNVSGFARVANDPKLIDVGGTVKVIFSVVTEEKRKTKDNEEIVKTPHFFLVEAWASAAEYISSNVFRGDLIYIDGSLKEEVREVNGNIQKKVYIRINNFRTFEN